VGQRSGARSWGKLGAVRWAIVLSHGVPSACGGHRVGSGNRPKVMTRKALKVIGRGSGNRPKVELWAFKASMSGTLASLVSL
jgi:hypothetical protein